MTERGGAERGPVLLVDDRPDTLAALESILGGAGCVCRRATTAQIALSLAHTQSPKVVVARLELAPMSGLDLLRELRRLSPPTRVILTADALGIATAITCMNEGADAVVLEPMTNPDKLLAAVDDAFAFLDRWNRLFVELQTLRGISL